MYQSKTELLKGAFDRIKTQPEFIGHVLETLCNASDIRHTAIASDLEVPTMYQYYLLCLCVTPKRDDPNYFQELRKIALYTKVEYEVLKKFVDEFWDLKSQVQYDEVKNNFDLRTDL